MFYSESDGFRDIQRSGGDTGYQRIEPMLKLFWEPNSAVKQRFEFKLGYTDFDANESYLGLTESDARAKPFDRYAATQFDNIDTFQTRAYLKWLVEPSDDFKIETSAYYNRFNRNWYKLDHVSTAAMPGADGRGRIAVGRTSLHKALLMAPELGITYDAAYGNDGYSMPIYVSATWTQAEFTKALASGGEDGIWDGAAVGNNLPYIPEWKLAAGMGLHKEKWGADLSAVYTSHQYGTALNLDSPVTSARQGKIDSAVVFDLSGYYKVNENLRLVGGINNLLDEEYVTSRVPHGPRNARGRHLYAGFEVKF